MFVKSSLRTQGYHHVATSCRLTVHAYVPDPHACMHACSSRLPCQLIRFQMYLFHIIGNHVFPRIHILRPCIVCEAFPAHYCLPSQTYAATPMHLRPAILGYATTCQRAAIISAPHLLLRAANGYA